MRQGWALSLRTRGWAWAPRKHVPLVRGLLDFDHMTLAADVVTRIGGWLTNATSLVGLFVILVALVTYLRTRKSIVFEAWVNMVDGGSATMGRSVADLLLFKLRFVKRIHEQGARKLDTWQPSREMPAFRQTLDEDIRLLGSVELGKYGSVVSAIVMSLLRLVPMMFRPARLQGSIHRYGDQLRLLANMEPSGSMAKRMGAVHLWEATRDSANNHVLPDLVEELAYRIYLDLNSDDLFKSWQAFRAYTIGLAHYVSWIDLERDVDWYEAETQYKKALALENKNPAIQYNLALLKYLRWRGPDNIEAIDLFRRALNTGNRSLNARARSGLASALAMQYSRFNVRDPRLLQEAIEHGRLAISFAPDIDSGHKAYALACHQWSEYLVKNDASKSRDIESHRSLAIKHYRRAHELNPNHFMALNNLGNLFLEWAKVTKNQGERQARLNDAKREFERALRINPAYHHVHDNLGNVHLECKSYEEAEKCFRTALQYAPAYAEAANDLAMLLLEPSYRRRSPSEALAVHLQAVQMAKDSPTQREKLCEAFERQLRKLGKEGPPTQDSPAETQSLVKADLESFGCTCAT